MFPRNAVLAKMYVQSDKRINHAVRDSVSQLVKNSAIATGMISTSPDFAMVYTYRASQSRRKVNDVIKIVCEDMILFFKDKSVYTRFQVEQRHQYLIELIYLDSDEIIS